ncbi:hypothetical protein ACVIGB_002584 [Bradyrhizobium sp. USDA 4341]
MQRIYGLVRSGDRFGYSLIGRTTNIFEAATGSAQFAHIIPTVCGFIPAG